VHGRSECAVNAWELVHLNLEIEIYFLDRKYNGAKNPQKNSCAYQMICNPAKKIDAKSSSLAR
jgi:hypothetical protein